MSALTCTMLIMLQFIYDSHGLTYIGVHSDVAL
jgi:hypothetical protein